VGWIRLARFKSVTAQKVRQSMFYVKPSWSEGVNLALSETGVLLNLGLKIGRIAKGRLEDRGWESGNGNSML